jgi:hypothetical protein
VVAHDRSTTRNATTPTAVHTSCRGASPDGTSRPRWTARSTAAKSSRRIITRPEAVEQRDARQDQRVGVRREPAHARCATRNSAPEPEPVAERAARHPVLHGDADGGVGQHGDEHREAS